MYQPYSLLGFISLDAGSWADWFSGTMSALAVITALAAYPLARRSRNLADKRYDKALGRAIGWKLLKVLNNTADVDRHIRTSLAKREPQNPHGMKFALVRPLGMPERPLQELNQSETDLLLRAQAGDLLAEIDMCIGRYASITYALNEYKNRHQALFELMPPPVTRTGMTFTHKLTKEDNERVEPYAAMLESLLDGIIALVSENMTRARDTVTLYDKDMKRYFGKALVGFEIDPAVSETK